MKKLTKVFLALLWALALLGAGYGWWNAVHSGKNLFAALSQAQLGPKNQRAILNVGNHAAFPAESLDGIDQLPNETNDVNPEDLLCVKDMQQMAQQTIDQYLAETGKPTERIDLQTQYTKTPDALRTKFGSGARCGAQYMYCDATGCSYSVYAMQKQGNFSTMAVSVMGTMFTAHETAQWHVSCFDLSEAGKAICAEYKKPTPIVVEQSADLM